jgi:hypothetical protein
VPAIETAVRAHGAVMSRKEAFGQPPIIVDAVVRLESDMRLIVQIVHARDELALISGGENFARLVKDARLAHRNVRGLCITLGAVIPKHVATLDAAFPETDLVNGEEAGIVERLPGIVGRALAPAPEPAPAPALSSLEALDEARMAIVDRAETQIARSQEVFGTDSRSEAVRQTSIADVEELARQKAALTRKRTFETFLEDATRSTPSQFVSALMRSPETLMTIGFGLLSLIIGFVLPTAVRPFVFGDLPPDASRALPPSFQLLTWVSFGLAILLIATGAVLAARLWVDVSEFRRFWIQTLRRLYEGGAETFQFAAANELIERSLLDHGPREGRAMAMNGLRTPG